jgi:hypothetical protein
MIDRSASGVQLLVEREVAADLNRSSKPIQPPRIAASTQPIGCTHERRARPPLRRPISRLRREAGVS